MSPRTRKVQKVEFRFSLPAIVQKAGKGTFVAKCPSLDVVSQGDTESEAKENLKEALELFLLGCFEMGTLEEVLRRSGFSSDQSCSGDADLSIEAPYFLMEVDLPLIPPALLGATS